MIATPMIPTIVTSNALNRSETRVIPYSAGHDPYPQDLNACCLDPQQHRDRRGQCTNGAGKGDASKQSRVLRQ